MTSSDKNEWVIYGIRLPGLKYRYIGYTTNLKRRIRSHKQRANKGTKTALYDWMRFQIQNDLIFETIEICISGNKDYIFEREMYWIRYYRNIQGSLVDRKTENYLLNHSDGGGGVLGYICSDETKTKISTANKGKVWSEESKNKMRRTLSEQGGSWKDKTFSEEHKKKISDATKGERNPFHGKNHTEDTKRKMSEAKKGTKCVWYGRKHTEETKEKIRQSNINSTREVLKGEKCGTSKLTVDKVKAMRVQYKKGLSITEISKEFEVSYSQTARVVKRESWKHVE